MASANAFPKENTVGSRIRQSRKHSQLRQVDLAIKIGISGSHLSEIERGAMIPTIPTLQKIGDALGRPVEYFIAESITEPRALGTVIPRSSTGELMASKFAQKVQEKSAGDLSVQIYQTALPQTIYEQAKGVAEGSIHIFIDDLLCFERYAPLCGLALLPYFFRDAAHYQRFLESLLFQEHISTKLLANGIRLLNPIPQCDFSAYELLFSTEPIFAPRDLAGRKFRSYASEAAIALRRVLDAEPVHVLWNQSTQAFTQGAIDTFLMPAIHHSSLALHGVANYATVLNCGYSQSLVVAVNEREYRRLSPDVQVILADAVQETQAELSENIDPHASDYLKSLNTEHGVAVIYPDTACWQSRFRQAVEQVCQQGFLDAMLFQALQSL